MKGYVYVMSNQLFPDCLKIGTSERDPESLVKEVQTIGSFNPCKIEYSVLCNKFDDWEIAVHEKLLDFAERGERQLYKVELTKVISVIKEVIGDYVLLEEQNKTAKDLTAINPLQAVKNEPQEAIRRKITYSDGAKYEGGWKNGKFHGKGKFAYAEGDLFEGEWEEGKRQGTGVYTWVDGQKYEGMFENGAFHGRGTMTYPGGQRYEGMFENGTFHGRGTMIYSGGQRYEGMLKDGSLHGLGEITYPAGHKYAGEFKDNKPHGVGTYTWPGGQKAEGLWKDGKKYEPVTDGIVLAMGISTLVLM